MAKLIVALLAVALAGCARGGQPAPVTTSETAAAALPAPSASVVAKVLAGQGLQITGALAAPKGFRGFVALFHGQPLPVYVTPDHRHILVGRLFDIDGHDLTEPAMAHGGNAEVDAARWAALARASWFGEGNPKAKHIVYAFVDTRCPYCDVFWRASQPWLKRGDVQVRDILVAVISPDSLPEAAKILDARDPAAAWAANERNFGHNAVPNPAAGSAASRAKVAANSELMGGLGFNGTPSIVYKDAKGRVRAIEGMPRDPALLKQIFGG